MSALTPSNRYPNQAAVRSFQEDVGCHLQLKTVIGTTTSSPNSFDSLPDINAFAVCAGSAVIVARVDAQLNITQNLFRARPNARPVNETLSFYNSSTPPISSLRSRLASSLKESGYGAGHSYEDSGGESPGTSQICKRTREATCISLSPEGNLLAVGEVSSVRSTSCPPMSGSHVKRGKNPRILIFPTTMDTPPDNPLSVLTDHSFGVRSVAFSPDSRWLCSLGDLHDGFLYLWSINEKTGSGKLHASNKCQNAHDIAWVGKRNLISFGTRHVKVWRLEPITPASPSKVRFEKESFGERAPASPGPKIFFGRNCLLGPLMDAIFTCLVAVSDSQAIICTDRGDVCLLILDENGRTQRLDRVAHYEFSISCVTYEKESGTVWIAGKNGRFQELTIPTLTAETPSESSCSSTHSTPRSSILSETKPGILAMGIVLGKLVTVDSDHVIELRDVQSGDLATPIKSTRLPAHQSAVLGVTILNRPNTYDSDFLTWSTNGAVLFWLLGGTYKGRVTVKLDRPSSPNDFNENELKVFRAAEFEDFFVSGDKEGVVRLIDRDGENIFTVNAHSGDVNDITIHRGGSDLVLVVSCGRDRSLQLFQKAEMGLVLLQTILDHVAAVNSVIFLNESTLISSSSDRTICVRTMALRPDQSIAFLPTRVIVLKASPVTLSVMPNQTNIIVVSTMDRQIHKFDINSGRCTHSFKASDPAGADSVILSTLSAHKISSGDAHTRVLLGVSSTDRSIRIYDYDTGSMLAKEHGQTVVSSIAVAQEPGTNGSSSNLVISTGLDGTVMIWDLAMRSPLLNGHSETLNRQDNVDSSKSPVPTQPLRRILSKSELCDFQRALDAGDDSPTPTRSQSSTQLRKKTSRHNIINTTKFTPSLPLKHSLASSPTTGSSRQRTGRDRSPTPPSPKITKISSLKRPSLDARNRPRSTGILTEVNRNAEKISQSLRSLRLQLTSTAESLKPNTAEELERELDLTFRAMGDKTMRRNQAAKEMTAGDMLDDYLARMIDERLALKVKNGDANTNTIMNARAEQVNEAGPPPLSNGDG